MRVIYHPDAEAELVEAAAFYDKRVRGLGDSFLQAFNTALADIEKQPAWWPILVVKHHKRHPDYWRYRLRDDG